MRKAGRMMGAGVIGLLLREAANGWVEHRAQRLSASLAFYTTLALSPLTLIAVAVAGYFYGQEAARGGIVHRIENLVGSSAAVTIESLIQKAAEHQQSGMTALMSIVVLLFGATGVFAELKDSLDTIWEVQRKPGLRLRSLFKRQLLAFTVVVATGFLLLASLVLTASLTAFTDWLDQSLRVPLWSAYVLDLLVSLLVITFLFALIFKLLPGVVVRWKDAWVGAAFTATLCMVGKFLIGLYIGRTTMGSAYGAAGSLVVILIWTYYSSLILFFGAELTRAYAKHIDPVAPSSAAREQAASQSAS